MIWHKKLNYNNMTFYLLKAILSVIPLNMPESVLRFKSSPEIPNIIISVIKVGHYGV